MALSKTVQFRGITVPNAYIRVVMPTIDEGKQAISFGVHYHAAAGLPAFDAVTMEAPYSLEGSNPLAQAYVHLKTLPEFAGATDV